VTGISGRSLVALAPLTALVKSVIPPARGASGYASHGALCVKSRTGASNAPPVKVRCLARKPLTQFDWLQWSWNESCTSQGVWIPRTAPPGSPPLEVRSVSTTIPTGCEELTRLGAQSGRASRPGCASRFRTGCEELTR
jgi:hypothetical protein